MYTLHEELEDGTLDEPFTTIAKRHVALRVAKRCAAQCSAADVLRFIVCKDDMTVAVFPVERPPGG